MLTTTLLVSVSKYSTLDGCEEHPCLQLLQVPSQKVWTLLQFAGQAVLKAAANGTFFPLKKRDTMLDYTMALMADEGAGYVLSTSKSLDTELLRTQVRFAIRSLSMNPTFSLRKTSCFVLDCFGADSF